MPASYLVRFLPAPISFGPLTALGRGEADAVVNNMGAVQYLVSTTSFKNTIRPPQGVLEPAYMAIALPPGSALKKPLDEALVGITASQECGRPRMGTSRAAIPTH